MPTISQESIDGIAYRAALPDHWTGQGPDALLVHGYPTSSYLWREILPELADVGYRAIAPDLPGFGDSPAILPGTWEQQIANLNHVARALNINQPLLVVHDWGGLIGLRWACDTGAPSALVITDTGFFAEGRWHGMAKSLQTEGEGEMLLENINRDLFAAGLRQLSPNIPDDAVDQYWKAFSDSERRQSQLDLYRSGDFAKLEPYEGKLAALDVPTKLIWGADDKFAPVGGAYRLHKQIPHSELVVLDGVGHFLMEDEPQRVRTEIGEFVAAL